MANPQWLTDMGNLGDDIVLGLDGSTRPHEIRFMPHAASAPLIAAGTDVSLEGQNLSNMTFGPPPPALPSQAPRISGTPEVGSSLSLAAIGEWGDPSITDYATVWHQDGAPVPGAPPGTGFIAPLVLAADQIGKMITLSVTAINAGGQTTAPSNAIGPVVAES
jgi:hypothetical protein